MNRRRLKEELAKRRESGFAQDLGEITPGVNVVSSPIFAHKDKLIGALILMGTFQVNKIQEYGIRVSAIARQISSKLGADIEQLYPK